MRYAVPATIKAPDYREHPWWTVGTDTGLAAWLMEQGAYALARPGNPAAGALLKTLVVNELMKLKSVSETAVGLFHFQDRDGREVDCVLETPAGRAVGIAENVAADLAAEATECRRRIFHLEDFQRSSSLLPGKPEDVAAY